MCICMGRWNNASKYKIYKNLCHFYLTYDGIVANMAKECQHHHTNGLHHSPPSLFEVTTTTSTRRTRMHWQLGCRTLTTYSCMSFVRTKWLIPWQHANLAVCFLLSPLLHTTSGPWTIMVPVGWLGIIGTTLGGTNYASLCVGGTCCNKLRGASKWSMGQAWPRTNPKLSPISTYS